MKYLIKLLTKDGEQIGSARLRIASSRENVELMAQDLLRRRNLNARRDVAGGDSRKAASYEIEER